MKEGKDWKKKKRRGTEDGCWMDRGETEDEGMGFERGRGDGVRARVRE